MRTSELKGKELKQKEKRILDSHVRLRQLKELSIIEMEEDASALAKTVKNESIVETKESSESGSDDGGQARRDSRMALPVVAKTGKAFQHDDAAPGAMIGALIQTGGYDANPGVLPSGSHRGLEPSAPPAGDVTMTQESSDQ